MLLSAATFSPIEDFSLSAIMAPNKTTGPIVAAKELATPVAAVVPNVAMVPLDAPNDPAIGPSNAIAKIPAANAPVPTAAAPLRLLLLHLLLPLLFVQYTPDKFTMIHIIGQTKISAFLHIKTYAKFFLRKNCSLKAWQKFNYVWSGKE